MATLKGCLRTFVVGFLIIEIFCLPDSARGQAIGFQPVPAVFPSGSILNVTPAVSADRRYVRMSLDVGFSQLTGFTTYSVPAAVSGGGAGMFGPIGGFGGAIAPGGLGGANGLHSTGLGQLGGPTVAEAAPGFAAGLPAGDPFEQARQGDSASSFPAPAGFSQEEKPRTHNPQANIARSRRRGALPRNTWSNHAESTRVRPHPPGTTKLCRRVLRRLSLGSLIFEPGPR